MFLLVGLVAFLTAFSAQGQVYNLKSIYGSESDTLTLAAATGTIYLSTVTVSPAPAVTTTIRVKVTEYSGTTAGTLTLQGSLGGTAAIDWDPVVVPNSATALATYTVADAASNVYDWVITGSPYVMYRVSWTATTATFSSKMEAQMFRSK